MFGPMHRYVPGLILGVRTYAHIGSAFVPCAGTCMSSSLSHSQLSAWVVLARLEYAHADNVWSHAQVCTWADIGRPNLCAHWQRLCPMRRYVHEQLFVPFTVECLGSSCSTGRTGTPRTLGPIRSAAQCSSTQCSGMCVCTCAYIISVQFSSVQKNAVWSHAQVRHVHVGNVQFSSVQFSSVQLFICRQVGSHQVHDVKALHTYQCAIFVHKHEACTYVHVHVYAWCALRRTDVHVYGN
jgi:hypothetical protein